MVKVYYGDSVIESCIIGYLCVKLSLFAGSMSLFHLSILRRSISLRRAAASYSEQLFAGDQLPVDGQGVSV